MMKKICTAAGLLLSLAAYSQVIIGNGKAAPTNTSVSLEFGTANKGIVLPGVDSPSAVTGAVPGTVIFNNSAKKTMVKLKSSWMDLSVDASGTAIPIPTNNGESQSARVVIGPSDLSTPGILILSDNNKAMILPTVNRYSDIVSPTAGMMVYLKTEKQLAFYNGSVWSFWKP